MLICLSIAKKPRKLYMNLRISNEIKVGLIGILTLAAIIYGMNYLRGSRLFGNPLSLYTDFAHAGGLARGAQVEYNGFIVGKVTKADMDPVTERIAVEITFDQPYRIPVDSKAIIYTNGIMGSPMIRIEKGKRTEYLQDEAKITGELEGGLMDKFGPLADGVKPIEKNIEILTKQISEIVHWVDSSGTKDIDKILSNVNAVTLNIQSLSARLEKDLDVILLSVDKVVANVNQLTESATNIVKNVENQKGQINEIMSKANSSMTNVEHITDSVALITGDMRKAITEAQATLDNVKKLTAGLERGEGTAGMLLKDKGLYQKLDSTVASANLTLASASETVEGLNGLLAEIKKNPRKYLNVRVYLLERKQKNENIDGKRIDAAELQQK